MHENAGIYKTHQEPRLVGIYIKDYYTLCFFLFVATSVIILNRDSQCNQLGLDGLAS